LADFQTDSIFGLGWFSQLWVDMRKSLIEGG